MNSLIERYVGGAVKGVPESERKEIGNEIRGAITEMVEPRIANGVPEEQADRGALEELGDPNTLASSYATRRDISSARDGTRYTSLS